MKKKNKWDELIEYDLSNIPEPEQFQIDVWETTDELGDLLVKKHHDYGPKNISQSPGGPINGLS